jgi:phospholipid-binding lipoprotein MlaA
MRKILAILICITFTIITTGCARKPSNPAVDPYENFNRAIFAFNTDIDHLVYRPASKVYRAITPGFARKGVSNVFDNIGELTTMPNDLLQGKIRYIFLDFWRLVINSTFGVGGLFDVATKLGLHKHYEDFGMTLAYWSGGTRSAYLVIPLLGPSTFRTAFGLPFDAAASPWPYFNPNYIGWSAAGLKYLNIRTKLLNTDKLVDDAFDPYIFVRNAYLQHRNRQIDENMKPYRSHADRVKASNHRLQQQPSLYRAPNGFPKTQT